MRNLILLHVAVVIFGFTGILGFEIQQDSAFITLIRTSIGAAGIALYSFVLRRKRPQPLVWKPGIAAVGLLIAAHWITFFEAIKVSKISVALAVLASTAVFVALLDPLIRRKPLAWRDVLLGAIAALGIVLIFGFEQAYKMGIVLGLVSAFLAALFTVINASLVRRFDPVHISFQELVVAAGAVLVYMLVRDGWSFWPEQVTSWDWFNLVLLGLVATSFAFVASIEVMKEISPFTVALTVNLEPVYTIALALMIYGESEYLSGWFYAGTAVLLTTVFAQTILSRRKA